jgi:RNA polymerase sigma-70 factor (ECF subfamily)
MDADALASRAVVEEKAYLDQQQSDLEAFESCRAALLALAYRMLGDLARAEDIIQEVWIRWQQRSVGVESPRRYLLRAVTNLCLNELQSAHSRPEYTRADRLPEPVDLRVNQFGPELLDDLSIACLVVLQRLSPAERAVLLLHEVFEFSHAEVANMLEKTEAACRQLLRRARENVALERRAFAISHEEHRRLLRAFLEAANSGNAHELAQLLTEDATLRVDGGAEGGQFGPLRRIGRPVIGSQKIATLVAKIVPAAAIRLQAKEGELNGQPALVLVRDGAAYAAVLISLVASKIHQIFIHADPKRLGHIGALDPTMLD